MVLDVLYNILQYESVYSYEFWEILILLGQKIVKLAYLIRAPCEGEVKIKVAEANLNWALSAGEAKINFNYWAPVVPVMQKRRISY